MSATGGQVEKTVPSLANTIKNRGTKTTPYLMAVLNLQRSRAQIQKLGDREPAKGISAPKQHWSKNGVSALAAQVEARAAMTPLGTGLKYLVKFTKASE